MSVYNTGVKRLVRRFTLLLCDFFTYTRDPFHTLFLRQNSSHGYLFSKKNIVKLPVRIRIHAVGLQTWNVDKNYHPSDD